MSRPLVRVVDFSEEVLGYVVARLFKRGYRWFNLVLAEDGRIVVRAWRRRRSYGRQGG